MDERGGDAAANFDQNQIGMSRQLRLLKELLACLEPHFYAYLEKVGADHFFFAFRWILCMFKREFDFECCIRLWEVLFCNYFLAHNKFQLFVALAMLVKQKEAVMANELDETELIKYIIDISGTMDVDEVLIDAEFLLNRFLYKAGKKVINEELITEILE